MTRPTARVLALLEILQSGGVHTVGELAGRLEVDERTVRRYAGHLADLGVPVESVRGRHGGYRLLPGYRMPPLMLTDAEALAVLLGLVAGRRAGLTTSSAVAAGSAAAKLRRVLPRALVERLDALLDALPAPQVPGPEAGTPTGTGTGAETAVLLRLAEAARDRTPVRIGHTSRDGRSSERTVHPYGIVAHSGHWYVTGADPAQEDLRTFRLDRIAHVVVEPGTFDVPAGFDPADHVLSSLARTPWRHRVSVLVHGGADEVRGRLPAGIATVEELGTTDGATGSQVRVRLHAERLDWVPGLLVALDLPFEVEDPPPLRDLLRALAARLAESADRRGS